MHVFVGTYQTVGNGVFHYRVHAPLAEAAYQGLATWGYGSAVSTEELARTDVFVGHLVNHPDAVRAWEEAGRSTPGILVTEYDDDYLALRADNPTFAGDAAAYEDYLATHVPAVRHALAVSDLVTVSVPHLAETYRQHTDAPVVVLPNTVDEVLLQVPQRQREPGERLHVGWGGSLTHGVDLRAAAAGVRYGLGKADARLTMMGADYRSLVGHRDAAYQPWADSIDQYYLALTAFHVVVTPLADDAFNQGKSPLKALEAAALGIPVVASDVGPYREFVTHGETGFLCRTDDDWMRALRALGGDEELRLGMGRRARERAAGLTTQGWAHVWTDAYAEALARRRP